MNNRTRFASASSASSVAIPATPLLGTKREWTDHVELTDKVGVSTNRWIAWLAGRGITTSPGAAKELLRLCRTEWGLVKSDHRGIDTLRRGEAFAALNAYDQKTVRAIWTIYQTIRDRRAEAEKVAKATAAGAPAAAPAPVAAAAAAAAPAPAPALPSVDGQCLTVDRQALETVLAMLHSGDVKEAITTLETLLS